MKSPLAELREQLLNYFVKTNLLHHLRRKIRSDSCQECSRHVELKSQAGNVTTYHSPLFGLLPSYTFPEQPIYFLQRNVRSFRDIATHPERREDTRESEYQECAAETQTYLEVNDSCEYTVSYDGQAEMSAGVTRPMMTSLKR